MTPQSTSLDFGSKIESPATQIESPATQIESPATQIESPATQIESPTTQIESPTTQIESPATQIESPTTQIESPATQIESPTTQIESPLKCKLNSLAFALLTLHTGMDDVIEPRLGFQLKPAENGQNAIESKLDSQSCDRQNIDLASPSLKTSYKATLILLVILK